MVSMSMSVSMAPMMPVDMTRGVLHVGVVMEGAGCMTAVAVPVCMTVGVQLRASMGVVVMWRDHVAVLIVGLAVTVTYQ